MKNTVKRVSALLMALLLAAVTSVPAIAETQYTDLDSEKGYPLSTDAAAVTVSGFESGQVESVTAYQIVDAEYDKNGQTGFSGYVAVKDLLRESTTTGYASDSRVKIFEKDSATGKYFAVYPTSEELSLLAEDPTILSNSISTPVAMTASGDGTVYTATLTVGEWMVIAKPKDDTVYNPMLVSVYYVMNEDGEEKIAVDPISAEDAWDGGLEVTGAYVKSSKPTVLKEITDNSRGNVASSGDPAHGDDHAIGDTVSFKISSMVPSYSDAFLKAIGAVKSSELADDSYTTNNTLIKYVIEDTLENGLTYLSETGLKVTVGAESYSVTGEAEQGITRADGSAGTAFTYSVLKEGDTVIGYKLVFDQAYVLSHDNQVVTIEYSAQLNEKASTVNYNPNENTVDVTYTYGAEPKLTTENTGYPATNPDGTPKIDGSGNTLYNDYTTEDTGYPVYDKDGVTQLKASDGSPLYHKGIEDRLLEDKTYHYTFEIDGDLMGQGKDPEGNPTDDPNKYPNRAHELIKLDENGNTDALANIDPETGETSRKKVDNPLQGAIFRLTRTDDDKSDPVEVYYAISDAQGHFGADAAANSEASYKLSDDTEISGNKIKGFKGLDTGTYTLEEVKAPKDYSLNKTTYTIEISAEYYEADAESGNIKKGMLKSYTIKVTNDQTKAECVTKHVATYENTVQGPVNTMNVTGVTDYHPGTEGADVLGAMSTLIKNTRLTDLPSTGGLGSYIFTIVGVAVMTIVCATYYRSRSKKVD